MTNHERKVSGKFHDIVVELTPFGLRYREVEVLFQMDESPASSSPPKKKWWRWIPLATAIVEACG